MDYVSRLAFRQLVEQRTDLANPTRLDGHALKWVDFGMLLGGCCKPPGIPKRNPSISTTVRDASADGATDGHALHDQSRE